MIHEGINVMYRKAIGYGLYELFESSYLPYGHWVSGATAKMLIWLNQSVLKGKQYG